MSVVRLFLVLIAVCAAVPASAEPMARCNGHRTTCVVDGDTVWISGEKIRLAGIDAPEVEGQCNAERQRAARAAERLAELLSAGPYRIERQGLDRYNRTLAVIRVGGVDVGAKLVGEGFARTWPDGIRWCD